MTPQNHTLLDRYGEIGREAAMAGSAIIQRLDAMLPSLWENEYARATAGPTNLLTTTFGDETLNGPFCRYLFDFTSDPSIAREGGVSSEAEDRVVAVWGVSSAASVPRDTSRMRGFLRDVWRRFYPGDDRGHFFAHTMGGGLDINLFPQAASVNRRGLWRRMEAYCTRNPGTFCFVRPIYQDTSWRPALLEYGIFKVTTTEPSAFWGHVFENWTHT